MVNITRHWKAPILLAFVALLIRFAYLADQQSNSVLFYQPLLDEQEMVDSANQLLAGKGFGQEPLFKAPLYPIYLAGVMKLAGPGWPWLARALQHLLGAILVLLAYDTARRLTASRFAKHARLAGMIAVVIVTFYGPIIRLESCLVLDFFTLWLQSAMLWALVRSRTTSHGCSQWKWALLAGVFAMLSWLNRPTLLPVLPFLALWILGLRPLFQWKRKSIRPFVKRRIIGVAVFLILPILGMGAFYVRNKVVSGEAMLLPWQGGYNFYYANKRGASGRYLLQESFSMGQTGNPTRELAEAGYAAAVKEGKVSTASQGKKFHAINSYWFNRGLEEIKTSTSAWFSLMVRKAVYLTSAREIFNFEDYDVQKELSPILRWLPFNFGFVWPLALASIAFIPVWPRHRRKLAGLMWMYVVLLGGAIALYFTSGRLRMPLTFPCIVLAASGVGMLISVLSKRSAPGDGRTPLKIWLPFAALLVIGVALSWGDWWGVRSENVRHLEYARLSNAAWRSGKSDAALKFADLSEQAQPGYPTVPLLRGQALYNLGKTTEAAEAFAASMKRLPDDPVAPFNLGIINYYYQNQPQQALEFFNEALHRQPTYHRAAWMGALAALRLKDPATAETRLRPYLPVEPEKVPPLLTIAVIAWKISQNDMSQATDLTQRFHQAHGDSALKELADELATAGLRIEEPNRRK